jgi:hypothetical protein
MDIWLAIITREEPMISVLGAYRTEELAEETAKRASPDDWETLHYVLDEIPYRIEEDEKAMQRLQNQSDANADPRPATQDAHEPS